ncbi:MAG TPA: prepilin-type N-terminal cleavage/methylation domain-containing protein [Stellaceae bacterium]|nr:prepilin-type N-terminal cleavage/methylation domain-containing protein [Stellaceae bacterium]
MLKRKRNAPPAPGFTLVEMLISVALIGLLTVFLFGGLRFGARAVDAGSERADRSAQLATAQGFLLAALQNAQALSMTPGAARRVIDFDGAPDRLAFVTLPPAYLAMGGLQRLTLAVVGGRNGRRLTVTWKLAARGAVRNAPGELRPSVLFDHVRKVAFGYFGVVPPDRTSRWHDRWSDSADLPLLIRLRIVLADGSFVPDILVAPRQARLRGSGSS